MVAVTPPRLVGNGTTSALWAAPARNLPKTARIMPGATTGLNEAAFTAPVMTIPVAAPTEMEAGALLAVLKLESPLYFAVSWFEPEFNWAACSERVAVALPDDTERLPAPSCVVP